MLTDEQQRLRAGRVTASRVGVLMAGVAEDILTYWQELTGQRQPEDISKKWEVRLGNATESINLDLYGETNGLSVLRRGTVMIHPEYDWAACTLDGYDPTKPCPVEAKHCGGYEPIEKLIERYFPQLTWQMLCTKTRQAALSVIMGANRPVVEYVSLNDGYADELMIRAKQFWGHVQARTAPVVLPEVPVPPPPTRTVSMEGSNAWADSAATWLRTQADAKLCKDAEKVLKAMMPDDAKIAKGHGVVVSRDRAGRLSLRVFA